MNTVKSLFSKLRKQNIKLVLKGENLEVVSMGNKMSAELITEIKSLKSEIIAYLKEIEGNSDDQRLAISKAPFRESYPLSSAQKRLWILSQFEAGSIAYNMPNTISLDGEYDLESFKKAVESTLDRHEVLRTVFKLNEEGEVNQWVLSREDSGFEIEDIDFSQNNDAIASAQELIGEDSFGEFDLENGPLLRAKLIKVEKDKFLFYYNMHHIVSDGWSVNVLINDVLAFYDAYSKGIQPELGTLPIQYKDYAHWQSDQMNTGAFGVHKSFWLNQFSDEVTVLELPMQKARPRMKSSNGKGVSGYLDSDATDKLKSLTQKSGGSLFMGVMAAVKAFLYRYSGEGDIIVGTPVAGRNHADLEAQIGFYVNMLPIRTAITKEDGMAALMKKTVANVSEGLKHQSYPFDSLVEELDMHRDATRNPLFNFSLTFDNISDGSDETLSEQELTEITIEDDLTIRFDLEFHIHEVGNNLALRIIYNQDLYDGKDIYRFLEHFKSFINAGVSSADTSFGELDFISTDEKNNYLETFNQTKTDYPSDQSIADQFHEQVTSSPEATALIFEDTEFTYLELDQITNKVARCLVENYRVTPGQMVGIQLDRNEWMIIAILATIKAGGVYVPIDPDSPATRKEIVISDADIQLLITEANYIFDLDYFEGEIFGIDVEFEEDEHSNEALSIKTQPSDLAYVMFTSGSTGIPKGVLVEQKSISRLVRNTTIYNFSEQDCLLSTGSPTFDATTIEYWGPLLNGGTLVLCSKETLLKTELLKEEIQKRGVNIMWFTAGWLSQLVESDIEIFKTLSFVMAGGDRLPVLQMRKLRKAYPDLKLMNGYGPTENTTFSLTYNIDEVADDIPIGYPVSNSTAYIINDENNLQPIGVVGEICLGGDGLARGYLNDTELTAEKFIPHPFIEGERIYQTGDLGKWDKDGCVKFIGRKDDQVKIRGYRIELAEIERAISSINGVDEATVIALENDHGDKDLIAYLCSEIELNASDLRTELKIQIPDYMIPAAFILLNELPLTKNGKVDRAALPTPEAGALNTGKELVEPRNKTEEKLVAIWKEVLKKEVVSVIDDFFELGGHSLKATILQNEYLKEFGVKPGFNELFANTSLESHVALLQNTHATEFTEIQQIEHAESYAVSDGQRRLWVLSQFEAGSVAYNMPLSMELQGPFNPELFERAMQEVVKRHEILRTVFRQDNQGEVRQWIIPAEENTFTISYHDFRSENDGKDQALSLIEKDSYSVFDLEKGPLIRSGLYQISENDYIFYFNMHHIVSDGWSMDILSRDVLAFYDALEKSKAVDLPELSIQYKDFAAWQLSQLGDSNDHPDRSFWMNRLNGELSIIDLPSSKIRPAFATNNGKGLGTYISKELTDKLKSFCQQEGGSLFIGLVALWDVLLYKYTGTKDVIMGAPVAGRDHSALKDQIGFYVNTLVLRNEVDPTKGFENHFQEVKKNTLESYEHQWYPFDRLVEDIKIPRNTGRGAIFDVMITLQNAGEKQTSSSISPSAFHVISEIGEMMSKFDLDITFQELGDHLSMDLVYNQDVYQQSMIEELMNHFIRLLELSLDSMEIAVADLNLLSEDEIALQLSEFNNPPVDYPESDVLEMFTNQVSIHSDKVAIRIDNKDLSYQELNEQSDHLANYLIEQHGVQTNDIIGIMLDRSEWQIIAQLAVLKSGAAYVPIDPEIPVDRVDYLKTDSQLTMCIDDEEIARMLSSDQPNRKDAWKDTLGTPELAYVMYTSGSTGNPKGVQISRSAMADYVQTFSHRFDVSHEDRIIQQSSLSFDVSIEEIFPALCNGATLILAPHGGRDVRKLAELIRDEKATIVSTVPLVISELNEYADRLTGLRLLISGGEELKKSHISNLIGKMSIVNSYGPTESTVCVTYGEVDPNSDQITIGKPIANRQVYILDEEMKMIPKGGIGEICVGGKGLAIGYHKREELTAEKFPGNPFVSGERIYRTGDLGSWTENGEIQFHGRNDNQVKIRGIRIELGEIEQVFISHEQVEEVVIMTHGEATDKELVAFIKWKEGNHLTELGLFLKQSMPAYMIPPTIIEVENWPETINGKIDKKALLELKASSTGKIENTPLKEGVETELSLLWKSTLKKDQIWANSDFFALGGHSLKAVKLIYQVHEKFDVQLGLQQIFSASTLREQTLLIETSVKSEFQKIEPAPIQDTYPISYAQGRIWGISQLGVEESVSYNLGNTVILGATIDPAVFAQAFDLLMERHEGLRTLFLVENGEPRQRIVSRKDYPFEIDLLDMTNDLDEEGSLQKIIARYEPAPFDLVNGPLMRASLVKLKGRYAWIFNMHHIISDGTSVDIMSRDLLQIYESITNGHDLILPELSIQYKDYVVWQNAIVKEDDNVNKAYWMERFSDEIPVIDLPFSAPRPDDTGTKGQRCKLQLKNELSKDLIQMASESGVTLYSFLLTGIKILLHKYTGNGDLIVGTAHSGRDHKEFENQVGYFINLLAIRSHFNDKMNVEEVLKIVNNSTVESLSYHDYPFDALILDLNLEENLGRHPLFDVYFNFFNFNDDSEYFDYEIEDFETEEARSKFDLDIYIREEKGKIYLAITGNSALFSTDQVIQFTDDLSKVYKLMIENKDSKLKDLTIANEAINELKQDIEV